MRDPIRLRIEKRIEAFRKGYRQNIGLIGHEGLGKTRLLFSIYNAFSFESGIIPIYVRARSMDYEEFVERWSGALLAGALTACGKNPPLHLSSLLEIAEPLIPQTVDRIRRFRKQHRREGGSNVLRDLFALPGILAEETGKKLVLMVDEFQELENLPDSDPFESLGREIMIQRNTLFIFTSSRVGHGREILRDKLSLLFGNFDVVEFGPWDFQESVNFLNSRIPSRTFSQAQMKFLVQWTDGWPLYLECLVERIIMLTLQERNPAFLAPESPAEISNHLVLEAFLEELFDRGGRLGLLFEKRLESSPLLGRGSSPYLRALVAVSQGTRRASAIASSIGKNLQETKKILQRLMAADLIGKCGTIFHLEDGLFHFWLREIYSRQRLLYTPDSLPARQALAQLLRGSLEYFEAEDDLKIASRVQSLFKEFRHDVIEIQNKKWECPAFQEMVIKPVAGFNLSLIAESGKARWVCQMSTETIREEEVARFAEEIRRSRKKPQQKILVALGGIDQNAKLMAQQSGIQIWSLRTFNRLLHLYDLPKVILLSQRREKHESSVGAVAQSLHSA